MGKMGITGGIPIPDLPPNARPADHLGMDRALPDFEWSHLMPDGRIVTNLTATRRDLLQVLRDVKADAAKRLADAHHEAIHARDLWVRQQIASGKRPTN